jgi:hypothetical protein
MRRYDDRAEGLGMTKLSSLLVAVGVLAAGVGGAALAYQATADPPAKASTTRSTPRDVEDAQVKLQRPVVRRVRFRPCAAGTQLEHGRCVRHVVRVIVVPAPAPTPSATVSTATQRPAPRHQAGSSPGSGQSAKSAPATTTTSGSEESRPGSGTSDD